MSYPLSAIPIIYLHDIYTNQMIQTTKNCIKSYFVYWLLFTNNRRLIRESEENKIRCKWQLRVEPLLILSAL